VQLPLAGAAALLAGATAYALANAKQTEERAEGTVVHAEGEKTAKPEPTLKRRPSWEGPFEGWTGTGT